MNYESFSGVMALLRNWKAVANYPLHRIAARLRFGMKLKSLVWAARGERLRSAG
jgi:hypothetical protein